MIKNLVDLYNHRYLLYVFTQRDLLARYKQTSIGVAWAVIQPLFLMVIFTLIFSKFLHVSSSGAPYPVFAYVALLPWTFINRSLTTGSQSLITFKNLVTKVYFPREIVPFAAVASAFVDFLLAVSIFVLMMIFYRIPITINILYIFILLPVQILIGLSFALLLSALTVLVRDLVFALPLLLQIWMYASPIIYTTTKISPQYQPLFYLNPLVGVIEGYRQVIVFGEPPIFSHLLVSVIFSLVFFFVSYKIFKKLERFFIDIL